MEGVQELEALRRTVRDRVGGQRYATWFEGAVSLVVEADRARVTASSAFELELVRKQFGTELLAAAKETLGDGGRVEYVVQPNAASTPSDRAEAARSKARRDRPAAPCSEATGPSDTASNGESAPAELLADWIDGPATAEATRACRRVLAGDPGASPMLLWGPAGAGKTHLLGAVYAAARRGRRRVLMLTAEQFLVGFVEALRGGGLPGFRLKHRGVQLLLIDNVHQLIGKERTLEELQHTIDTLEAEGARVVLTSDRGPSDLVGLGPELVSRLAGGLSAELGQPDPTTRTAFLRRAAKQLGRELPDAVVSRLAGALSGGYREVSGAVNRLLLLHETHDLPLDAALADRAAGDVNRVATPPVRIEDIQKAVCGVFGVDAKTLRSKKRTKSCTEPRMLAMWLARRLTGSAWSEIGAHFGQRSHSTVISAHRRVETLLEAGGGAKMTGAAGELREAIRRVEAALRRA